MARKKQQKAEELPLVAIDMGSSGIRAMAAEYVDEELFRILGVEESNKFCCVEHGIVRQTSNAAYMIGETLRLLSNRIGIEKLPTAFVCMGGQSMKVTMASAKRDLVRRQAISQKILDELEQECHDKIERKYPKIAVLGIVPSYFILDGNEQDTIPTSEQHATLVCGNYIVFYAEKEAGSHVKKSFDQAGKSIEHEFARPEALLSVFASEDGNQILTDGCAVLDMGAQTTTLSVFKGGEYLTNKVVARGGEHITKLLEQQGIDPVRAEKIKCLYGFASPDLVDRNVRLHVPSTLDGGERELELTSREIATLIEGKLREILQPLLAELHKVEERIARLYITGGGSMLQGMEAYLQQQTGLEVMYGGHDLLLAEGTDPKYLQPTYSALVGTILLGHDYRSTHKDKNVPNPTTILDSIRQSTITLFSEQEQQ